MNIKKTLSNFGDWIYVVLTCIGFILIILGVSGGSRYHSIGNSLLLVPVGLVLVLPFVFSMIKSKLMEIKVRDENAERIDDLIRTGEKIIVDLDELKIQTNSYKQEISVGSGYDQRNEYIDINHNVILLKIPYQSQLIKIELHIEMDPTILRMHLAIKGKTVLYVDPKDMNNNHLDLSFLEK